MAKRSKRRSAFPVRETAQSVHSSSAIDQILADDRTGGVFGFFRDVGVRETIESIIVAIVLALMFRAYEAEAFIIPTGSMAPSLQGQHMDLECENCGFRYRSGASYSSSTSDYQDTINSTVCPICQYRTKMARNKREHQSYSGDRILVNKFIYDFNDPERYDVIVFKNPNNGKQNYIKRLIGLPGDNILIENGDIYLMHPMDSGDYEREITRKPPRKLRNTLQTVDDTNFIGKKLVAVNWPSRWQSFNENSNWDIQNSDDHPNFVSDATDEENWLRYRHFQPLKKEWATIEQGDLPSRFQNGNLPDGRLIGDQYGYNDGIYNKELDNLGEIPRNFSRNLGLHWVGDIGVECWIDIESSQGTLLLDLVEGGAHFTCEIDVATGVATLRCDDSQVDTKVTFHNGDGESVENPTAQTNLDGQGEYHIEYVNADDRINLWINNRLIEFDAAEYTRIGIPIPTFSTADAGDAEPAGIGTRSLKAKITRVKILRDIYYTSVKGETFHVGAGRYAPRNLENEMKEPDISFIEILQRNPERWSLPKSVNFFEQKKGQTEPMFELEHHPNDNARDQFLPMGDNSPKSLDGRVWNGPHYVERDMLIGRAMFIYWPHSTNKPIPFFPNFQEMGFIQ